MWTIFALPALVSILSITPATDMLLHYGAVDANVSPLFLQTLAATDETVKGAVEISGLALERETEESDKPDKYEDERKDVDVSAVGDANTTSVDANVVKERDQADSDAVETNVPEPECSGSVRQGSSTTEVVVIDETGEALLGDWTPVQLLSHVRFWLTILWSILHLSQIRVHMQVKCSYRPPKILCYLLSSYSIAIEGFFGLERGGGQKGDAGSQFIDGVRGQP
jgi:hypothetical protein